MVAALAQTHLRIHACKSPQSEFMQAVMGHPRRMLSHTFGCTLARKERETPTNMNSPTHFWMHARAHRERDADQHELTPGVGVVSAALRAHELGL
jgi:hypothetical protein